LKNAAEPHDPGTKRFQSLLGPGKQLKIHWEFNSGGSAQPQSGCIIFQSVANGKMESQTTKHLKRFSD
jgi:hypothetical protein